MMQNSCARGGNSVAGHFVGLVMMQISALSFFFFFNSKLSGALDHLKNNKGIIV